jgi:hypothetical protein
MFAISNPKVKQDRFFLCTVHAARIFMGVYRRQLSGVSGYTTHSGDKERAHHEHYGSGRSQLVT